jgi:hypothetical protein
LDHATADVLSIGQTKRYLTEITQQDASTPGKTLPATKFEYYGVAGVASGPNNGALKKIIYPDGGEIEYSYSYQTASEVQLDKTDTYSSSIYPVNLSSPDIFERGFSGSDFKAIKVTNGSSNFIYVYRWGINGWYQDNDFPITSTTPIYDFAVINDYIIVRENLTTMKVVKRKGEGWETPYNVHDNLTVGAELSIAGAGNFFFVVRHNRFQISAFWYEYASVVTWNDGNWSVKTLGSHLIGLQPTPDPHPLIASSGPQNFVLRAGQYFDAAQVWSWSGYDWDNTKTSFNPSASKEGFSPAAGRDYFVTYNYGASTKNIKV